MADPTLIIHFSPLEGSSEGSSPSTFERGDDGKEIAWYALAKCQPLRISNGQTTGKEVSVFSLPFPLAVVPYFLEVLNALQQIDESSQSRDASKKIELDKVQVATLENLGLKGQVETLQNLKFLEKDGSLCEKPYENLGRWIGEALRRNSQINAALQSLFEDARAKQRAVAAFRQKLYIHTPAVSWYVPVLYVQSVEPYQPYSPFKPATPIVNPFVLGPAAHTQKFIGRRAEVRKMWELVRGNYSFSIVGPAGAGKTRMMRLIKDGRKEGKIDKNTSIIWIELYSGMDRKDVEQEIMSELRAEKGAHIREVLNGKHILILLDKLYRLNPRGDRDLLERLASLPSYDGVQLVVTIREPIADLFPQEEPSSLYEIANMSIRLECFNKGEIEELVKDRLAATAFKFEDFNDVLKEQMTPRDLLIACHKKFNELTQS